jgi:hypothetical protein
MTLAIDRPTTTLTDANPVSSVMAPVFVVSPPRLNFAGVCNYCEQRDCTSTRCVARHAASRWAICPECGGYGSDTCGLPCEMCLWGIVEWYPTTSAPPAHGQATHA